MDGDGEAGSVRFFIKSRTLVELFWLAAAGFLLTIGLWGVVYGLLHVIDSVLGLEAFSPTYLLAFVFTGMLIALVAIPLLLSLFAYRYVAKWLTPKTEAVPEGFWTRASLPPFWMMFILAIAAFVMMIPFWIPALLIVVPGPTAYAGLAYFCCFFLPVCIPFPLLLPAFFWLSFGTFVKSPRSSVLLLALLWGFLSTVPSMLLNSSGESVVSLLFGPYLTLFVASAIIPPLVEETMKPLILIPLIGKIKDERDGFLIGLAAGIGFAVIENLLYVVNSAPMSGPLLVLRSYNMVLHAIGPCIIGYYLGKARRKGSFLPALLAPLGWVAGVAIHMLWNGASSINQIITMEFDTEVACACCLYYLFFMLLFPLFEWAIVIGVGLRARQVGTG